MSNHIEIRFGGNRLTPEKFLVGVKEFLSLVQGVTRNVTTAHIDWTVEVDRGSAIVRMWGEGNMEESEKSIQVICQGIRSLRTGVRAIPFGFKREHVTSAKILAELADESTDVSIKNGSVPEVVPHEIVAVANAILEGQHHIAFGSVEGKIVSLSAKHGYICVIDDPSEGREITCYLQTGDAQKKAVEGYTKRVIASGLIHYAKEGHPVNITVDDIRIFPADSELPTLADVQEIYRQFR